MNKYCIIVILLLSNICLEANQNSIESIVSVDSNDTTGEYDRMIEYEKNLQSLCDKLENMEKSIADQNIKIDALEQEIENIRGSSNSDSAKLNEIYSKALEAFKEGRFNCAEQLIQSVESQTIEPNLKAKFMFLWGGVLSKQGLYENSLKKYIDSYKILPEGQKSSDSMIRMSMCLHKLNRKTQACSMLKKFEDHKGYKTQASLLRHKDLYEEYGCKNE